MAVIELLVVQSFCGRCSRNQILKVHRNNQFVMRTDQENRKQNVLESFHRKKHASASVKVRPA
jgi:hypothetical protein